MQFLPKSFIGTAGFFAVLVLPLAVGSKARAETEAPTGDLLDDETWTKNDSPYILRGDLTIPEGVTLTVEPGVEVRAWYSDTITNEQGWSEDYPDIIVAGTLNVGCVSGGLCATAEGQDPVTFRAAADSGQFADYDSWGGFQVWPTGSFTFIDGTIQNSKTAVQCEAGSTCVLKELLIRDTLNVRFGTSTPRVGI